MKKRLFAMTAALVLLLALPLRCIAELKKGDRGEEVKYMQQMLIEMGFMNDKADGIFGKKTEAGVKALQKYLDMPATGVLDDDTQVGMYDVYSLATGMMADDGLGDDELMELYPAYCSWEGQDEWGAVFCWRHLEQQRVSTRLQVGDPPKKLKQLLMQRLCELWEGDIQAMFDEWEEALPEEEAHIAQEQRALFEQALTENRKAWNKKKSTALENEMIWLEEQGIGVCFDMHGAEANPVADAEADAD